MNLRAPIEIYVHRYVLHVAVLIRNPKNDILTKDEKCMARFHEDQYPPEQIFMQYVVFYMVRMMLYAKREELKDETEQLNRAGEVHVIFKAFRCRVGQ